MTSISEISWTPTTNAKDAITHALFAGYQSDGKRVYVGKVLNDQGHSIISKIIPEDSRAFFIENGIEKSSEKMEYLFHSDGYEWLKSSSGKPVPGAVIISENYIGRAEVDGTTIIGNVDLKSKQMIASYYGRILNLREYDVLVFKPQRNKIQFQQSVSKESTERYGSISKDMSLTSDAFLYNERMYRDNLHDQQKILEMQNKIQSLELELSNYKNDRKHYEQKILFEQKRVQDLNEKMQSMRIDNSSYIRERSSYEEKLSFESSKISDLELRLKDFINENALLLKKVANLEETLRTERSQMEAYAEKFKSSQSSISGPAFSRLKSFEEKIKSQQQRIFELEMMVENSYVDGDSWKSQLTSYEKTIEHQKIQLESILKKLQNANADNEYLIKKIALLSQSLRNCHLEIESMAGQLQNAKNLIANLNAELARSNSQLSKFQTALSNSYVLNGELMTKVSSLNSFSQYQNNFKSKFDILNVDFNNSQGSGSAYTYNTPLLLEATGSETYKYVRSTSKTSSTSEKEVRKESGSSKTSFDGINGSEKM